MKFRTVGVALAVMVAMVAGAGAASAETKIYMKMDGVTPKNDKPAKGHEGQIVLTSIYSGINTPVAGTLIVGTRTGKLVLSDTSVTKLLDSTSVRLRELAVKGSVVKTVEVTYCKSVREKEQCYYTLTLKDVVISNIDHGMSTGEDDPTESITLNAQSAAWKYQVFDELGNVSVAPMEAATR